MSTIREVAKQAGVSIATVSRVMNGHESVTPALRERVLRVVDDCDYVRSVGRRTLDTVALIYLGQFTVEAPYDAACLTGMVAAVREHGMDLTLLDIHRDRHPSESLRQFFHRKGVAGAVLRGTEGERSLVEQYSREGVPLVVLGDHFPDAPVPCVWAESRGATCEAIDYLWSLGHRRFGFAASDLADGDHVDRYEAYRSVLAPHGVLDERHVWRIPPHRFDGVQLIRSVMAMQNRPTALFVADPLIAVGAIMRGIACVSGFQKIFRS